ncbi:TetR/AcrR family transcriptional regulator [Psychromicrobium xiongbiense]|uniref:TetR/AcrR family transcriptional regulator n=1 Tax=Psychromicrobium xiongbiense TaxID=3051184 RepID=UPI002552B105|nr:TetR/AcrR family transcriptional regulator [Psychromicrobium sp. YIM S02556]
MSAAPIVRRPARTEITRQRIFDASMQLIGERGPAEVTVDEIAAAAGVSKGTVYYNFGSKAELIAQLLEYGVELLEARLAPRDDLPSLAAVEQMLRGTLEFFDAYPSFTQLLVSEMWRTPSAWRDTLTLLRERLFTLAGATLDRIPQEHAVREGVSPQGMVGLVLGAALVMGLDRQVFNPERSREESLHTLMTTIHGYLRD